MHLIVIILGFTGILGKLINCSSTVLVWYRLLFASLLLWIYLISRKKLNFNRQYLLPILGVGCIVSAHWLFFFESIKVSNVSVAVVCMGTSSLFSSFLEPIILKRKIHFREIILAIVVLIAIGIAMQANFSFILGYIYGIIAAFLATLFTIFNALYVSKVVSEEISLIEMTGGFIVLSFYMIFSNSITISDLNLQFNDFIYLLILGGLCTAFAFAVSVEVMKSLTPFNVIMAVNLEPVYSILLALVIFGDSENMNISFYIGAILIIGSVFIDGYLKKNNKLK